MKSVKTFNYTLRSGNEVTITVTRIYGNETIILDADGYKIESNKFMDDFNIDVSVPGLNINGRGYLSTRQQYQVAVIGNQLVVIPDNIAAEIISFTKELLTDEISDDNLEEIECAKKAIANNKVLPQAEIMNLRKKYNNDFNERGTGYNPYDYYMSSEAVEEIKRKFKQYFN